MIDLKLAHTFLDHLFEQLQSKNINIDSYEIDHLCYRTSSDENYQVIKDAFSPLGECLIESEVNGRLIATYKLKNPILYKHWIIDLIEVPAPKQGKITQEGFEHIEVVIDCDFEELEKSILLNAPDISFEKKGLEKDLNPELEIEFDQCAVKFHHKSLENIIAIEKNAVLMDFLNSSQILNKLKSYSPCISGTLPLNIHTPHSDLDILFCAQDLAQFERDVTQLLQGRFDLQMKRTTKQGQETSITVFHTDHFKVELFAQNYSSFKQQANIHFLIEARLLKIFKEELRQRVKALKEEGHKTEPAFGMIFNLSSPYDDLIKLNKLSDLELSKLL